MVSHRAGDTSAKIYDPFFTTKGVGGGTVSVSL
jgi:C4-dicarboxylate-specific signal transduction histidine kinase